METQLAHIKLSDITVSDTNVMFRDESELNFEALEDLVGSIREKGVIQPALLRPGSTEGTFILVCGERRFRASLIVQTEFPDRNTIPAYIRPMTDEEAFELQVTENLQRKDVHPLKEAKAYQFLMNKDSKITVAELALRFGKSETYITLRLKLNDLIKEAKKDFQEGKMSLGHALVLARLTADDQKEAVEECSNRSYYETVHELEDFVERHIVCSLSSAPFKKDDETLDPKAGPCTTCVHRSGASPLLFPDIKEKDRCFNKSCLENKSKLFVMNKIAKVLEDDPEIMMIKESWKDLSPEVDLLLKSHKVTPLVEYKDFDTAKNGKVKGLWVAGSDIGKVISIAIKKQATQKAASGEIDFSYQVEQIKQRTERAKELDNQKVYTKIVEALKIHPTQKITDKRPLTHDENHLLTFMIFDMVVHNLEDGELKKLKLPEIYYDDIEPEKVYERICKITAEEKTFLFRRLIVHKYCTGSFFNPESSSAYFIRKVVESYGDIPIADFEAEQETVRTKREANAKKKIDALKAEAKEQKQEAKAEPKQKKKKVKETVDA